MEVQIRHAHFENVNFKREKVEFEREKLKTNFEDESLDYEGGNLKFKLECEGKKKEFES